MNIKRRIEDVLKLASVGRKLITYEDYEQAVVEQPRRGSEVLLRRDIDEIFINNYNPEWIVNWNANIDLSPVYDYFGTITYVTDYFTKVKYHKVLILTRTTLYSPNRNSYHQLINQIFRTALVSQRC